jgi:hypothetical protein
VKVSDHKEIDDIFYDNKKDNNKIHNRSISPDEMKENNVYHTLQAEPYERRNM